MAGQVTVLQINVNRSRLAQDLALANAQEIKADFVLLSEPNKSSIKDRADWICDASLNTAIKVANPDQIVIKQGAGKGFSYATTPQFTIYSCYISPNATRAEAEEILQAIGDDVAAKGSEAIIAGDFNAKSPLWGMPYADRRGEYLAEWIAERGLITINHGSEPTFLRCGYGSILDLTMATESLSRRFMHWEVSEAESLSDHRCIVFTLEAELRASKLKRSTKGWNPRGMDKSKLTATLLEKTEGQDSTTLGNFSRTLVEVCDACMRRKHPTNGHPPRYWWNDEIARLRAACIRTRRRYTRHAKENNSDSKQLLWAEYQGEKKTLQRAIKEAKRKCWQALCDDINRDVWGKGYQIVKKRLLGNTPRTAMSLQTTKKTVDHLFPQHERVRFPVQQAAPFVPFTKEELLAASRRIKSGKSPGPGGIPPDVLKHVASTRPQWTLSVYNELATKGVFPKEWKRAQLILLRKGTKPAENPSSYRPICLLDAEGKLFEQLLLARLKEDLQRTGGLANNQYGFREGRQTVDAVKEVLQHAEQASAYSAGRRRLCAVITIDVRNAFNSASWQVILDDLRARGTDESLINLISSYLSEREILYEAEGKTETKAVSSGVPQGSVLGPTLWNIQYDALLRMDLPEGVHIVGFADDIALVIVAQSERLLMDKGNLAILEVVRAMQKRQLHIAPEKTEAILLTKKRKLGAIHFEVQGIQIVPGKTLKQLGVWLDSKTTFGEHIRRTAAKAEKTMAALAGLMPNIKGPRQEKRRILASVVHSAVLYAAPIWYQATRVTAHRRIIRRLDRTIGIRVCSGYRTISTDAIGVIAGIPPIELLAAERNMTYNRRSPAEARDETMTTWQTKWDAAEHGRWTHKLIPNIRQWTERSHGEVDYYMTQALSGHGCFRKFLHDRNRSETDKCPYCGMVDDVEHVLFACPRWRKERDAFKEQTGHDYTARRMMENLLKSQETWNIAHATTRQIIECKEREQREPSSATIHT